MVDIAVVLFVFAFGLGLGLWISTYWYQTQLSELRAKALRLEQDYDSMLRRTTHTPRRRGW